MTCLDNVACIVLTGHVLDFCFRLFIVVTGCPSEQRLVVTENSARIQNETTESPAWFFSVLVTRDLCLKSRQKDNNC